MEHHCNVGENWANFNDTSVVYGCFMSVSVMGVLKNNLISFQLWVEEEVFGRFEIFFCECRRWNYLCRWIYENKKLVLWGSFKADNLMHMYWIWNKACGIKKVLKCGMGKRLFGYFVILKLQSISDNFFLTVTNF